MKRTYLIDSENINDIWVEILHCMEDKDEILVFYTDKSAHMGYDRIIRLMEHKRGIVRWIRCFEGQNALDFQLVTELGSRISQEPKREYIIVSNDTGYDAVVRYWQQKEYRVRRMKSVECENLPDMTEELKTAELKVSELKTDELKVDKPKAAVTEPVVPENKKQDLGHGEAENQNAEVGRAEHQREENLKSEHHKPESQRREYTDEKALKKKTDRLDERKKGRKKLSELRAERMRRQAEEEAVGAGTTVEVQVSEAPERMTQAIETPIHETPIHETPKAETQTHGNVSFTTAESWHEELETIFRESGSQDAGGDMRHLTELCKTVKLSDMSMVHNVLEYHFGQERGNAVYRFIKENPGCRGELSAGYSNNKKQRERQYLNLILKRNHIIAEDGELDAILKILGGIPRKNLNAIHIALVKRFGQEHGGTCYAVLRNHVNIVRSL